MRLETKNTNTTERVDKNMIETTSNMVQLIPHDSKPVQYDDLTR